MSIEEINARLVEIRSLLDNEDSDLEALETEANELMEERAKLLNDVERRRALITSISEGAGTVIERHDPVISEEEKRANEFVKTGKMELRALLSTGTIAKPTKVGGINDLPEVGIGIVDDVNAISLTGNGSWVVAYKKTEAVAADVTDGSAVAGTASTYGTVTINPAEWGVYDEISKQVKKMTPLNYQSAISRSALLALRIEACDKITAAVIASALTEKKYSVALDQDYLRGLVLGYAAHPGKGAVRLYLNRADLMTLGKVRGTQDKKPVYTIRYDAGTTASGVIEEGGTAVAFRVVDNLTTGTQLFGQPGTIDMPMWDNYEIATNEGGELFQKNMIGIRGLQTANADVVAYHGMQVISQSAEE